jgi:ABC-type dipeptide/oligopeptide/nickel transport system permease subunit
VDIILDIISRGLEQLLGRASGPFHLRLVITPAVAFIFAIRAGLRDAREGHPPFLWEVLTNPAERQRLRRSWWKDIGKMVIVALITDAVYQLYVLRAFYVFQALILIVVLAMGPYALVRGITTRLTRRFYIQPAGSMGLSAAKKNQETEGR